MSRKKNRNIKKQASAPQTGKSTKPKPERRNWSVERPSVVSPKDALYKNIFLGSAFVTLLTMIFLSLGSGINQDDEYQVDYSEKLVSYYTTMGQDTSALYIEKGNMHLYGGFFDLTTGLVNHALGYNDKDIAYHNVRHIFNAIIGFLAMLFVALAAKEIAGWRAGILALIFMFLSPRFLGHSFMNPKDIPFAAGFAIANFYTILLLKSLPKPTWSTLIGLALGIALALATRAGGLLLIAYLGLFMGLDFLAKYGFKGLTSEVKTVGKYALYGVGIVAVGYILAVLTWPWAMQSPIANPLKALSEFSKFGIRIRLLYDGENIMSDNVSWLYPIVWIGKTIPLFVLIGFIGSIALVRALLRQYAPLPVLLMFFATVFPVAYIIYQDSILYDGWRHLMFVYPSMVVLAALFWIQIEKLFSNNKIGKFALYGILGLLMVESGSFIVRNPKIPYIYFNPIGGGLKGAYGNYETDYWGVSTKQALEWMEDEGIIGENMQDTVVVTTSFWYPVSRLAGKYNGKVRVEYSRFNSRYNEFWEYGIFPSRFIRGPHLRSGKWPNSKTVHTVSANGIPLTAIEHDVDHFAYRGEAAIRNRDYLTAIEEFKKEVEQHPDNELVWQSLASAYINSGNFQLAINAANEALRAAPQNETSLYFLGLAYLNTGNIQGGINALRESLQANDENAVVYYYLAVAYQQMQSWSEVLANAQKAIELNPRFKQAYELAATALEQMGNAQAAAQYRQAASQL